MGPNRRRAPRGGPLHRVVFPFSTFGADQPTSPRDRLTQTEWAQPALGATSLSILELLTQTGIKPEMVGGHSFGELSALAAAGALSPLDLILIARKRGELMAPQPNSRGNAGSFSNPQEVQELIQEAQLSIEIANHNAPSRW